MDRGPSCHILPPHFASSPRRWTNHQHASTKAERLQTVQWTLAVEAQRPRRLPDSPAGEDDEHLNAAPLLTEQYGVELTGPWSLDVAEKRELLQGSQELVDCPPRSPDWALWTLITSGPQKQVVLEYREPEPIDHPQESHRKLPSSLEGETDEK